MSDEYRAEIDREARAKEKERRERERPERERQERERQERELAGKKPFLERPDVSEEEKEDYRRVQALLEQFAKDEKGSDPSSE